jgi:DNA-binding CsgD family transcriptional regulator
MCPVVVGREVQARHLRDALAAADAGTGRAVLVAGEAGIGKSRLVRQAADAAREKGFTVLTGRAVAGGVPTPFRSFAEALAAALRPGGMPADAGLDPFRPALGRLVPHLQSGGEAAYDGSLVFLGEAVLRLVRVLSGDRACMLLLEDLHWADRETLALVEYLADNVWVERFLLVGTFRPDEGSEVADLAAKLESRGSADLLPLDRLDASAMVEMAQACLDAATLPADAEAFLAERAEGVPFLIEEVLAGLLDDGALVERDGRWEAVGPMAAGVPASFADAVSRRLAGVDPQSRQVIRAAAVLGRRFDWAVLSLMVGGDEVVTAALRTGVEHQLIAIGNHGFRFRHALTQEAVLAALLPPERAMLAREALRATEAAHPGLSGQWCVLAAELAERSGDPARASELLLEAGRRDLAVGALVSAEQTLTRARRLGGADEAVSIGVDEALTEVLATAGQVDRAMEIGRMLLARIGRSGSAGRSAELHLQIARAAIAGVRWADAEESMRIVRELPHAEPARVDACAAQIAVGRGDLAEADRLARAALRAAEDAGLSDVACEALEVIGKVAGKSDLDEAERAYVRAEAIASAHGRRLWQARTLHALGGLDALRTGDLGRLLQARELAATQGALFQTALLDLDITAGLIKQVRADEALDRARSLTEASRRFRLASLAEALLFQANAHAIRGEADLMEARIAEALPAAPAHDASELEGWAWGRCRATLWLHSEERERACDNLEVGSRLVLAAPAPSSPPFLGLWPLLSAALCRDGAAAASQVRAGQHARHGVIADLLGYADAIMAGRRGDIQAAEAAFTAADLPAWPQLAWYRQYGRRTVAEAALAGGWGDPVPWLQEAEGYFESRGEDRIAAACRKLLREAGAPVPRRRAADAGLPGRLRSSNISGREADVLALVAQGLTNREIAERMFLSPRTVEKHVASLLAKTGLRRRAQLAGYLARLSE